eukprot:TRINITY_DN15474_c0_g1_i1.p2 TRINITY_DN15474_c0_g1~~TRINITY_DN15474_c0_g1_i1.p2  ORF type:complete len:108 (-),score=16.86 TRINITY_DN15474_c0_g1_i1:242-565(-)
MLEHRKDATTAHSGTTDASALGRGLRVGGVSCLDSSLKHHSPSVVQNVSSIIRIAEATAVRGQRDDGPVRQAAAEEHIQRPSLLPVDEAVAAGPAETAIACAWYECR